MMENALETKLSIIEDRFIGAISNLSVHRSLCHFNKRDVYLEEFIEWLKSTENRNYLHGYIVIGRKEYKFDSRFGDDDVESNRCKEIDLIDSDGYLISDIPKIRVEISIIEHFFGWAKIHLREKCDESPIDIGKIDYTLKKGYL